MNKRLIQTLVGLLGSGLIVAAIALSLPDPQVVPGVVQPAPEAPTAPKGCRPVAPGAYTFICENTGSTVTNPQPTPQAPTAPQGCRPVAPGSYTFICEGTGSVDPAPQPTPQAPTAPQGCRPVAPGSYSFICESH